jgi:hypothetical protein
VNPQDSHHHHHHQTRLPVKIMMVMMLLMLLMMMMKKMMMIAICKCFLFLNFFLWAILCYSQSGNNLHEDLAKFGYKLNMKVNFLKHSFYIFGYPTLNHVQKSIYFS